MDYRQGDAETDRMVDEARRVLQHPADVIEARKRHIRAERRARIAVDVIELALGIIIVLGLISLLIRG